jgi:hypothetical protein
MYETTYIIGANQTLKIEFEYMPGRHSTYDEPAEDAEIDINDITCHGLDFEIDDIYIKERGELVYLGDAIETHIWENLSTIMDGGE